MNWINQMLMFKQIQRNIILQLEAEIKLASEQLETDIQKSSGNIDSDLLDVKNRVYVPNTLEYNIEHGFIIHKKENNDFEQTFTEN